MSGVDVVIPCYKYAHYLRGCVRSVLDQAGVEVRVLIIDDCSPDDTPRVATELVKSDPRVSYRRHSANRGHIDTYNEGLLGWASADYCLLLSADDLLMPDALQRATRLMDAHPDVSFTYGRAIHTPDPSKEIQLSHEGPGTRVLTGPQFIRLSCEEATNLVPTPTAIVRTCAQQKAGGYRRNLPHSGDMEMWLRLAAIGSVGVVDAELAYYRIHPAAMSVGYEGTRDLRAKKAALDSVFAEYGTTMLDAANLRRLAIETLGTRAFHTAGVRFEAGDDATTVQEYLDLAVEIFPQIADSRDWSRFATKRKCGRLLWNAMTRIAHLMRSRRSANDQPAPPKDWLRAPWIQSQHC